MKGDHKTEQDAPLPTSPEALFVRLRVLDIAYEYYEHEPVYTVEESAGLKKTIPGTHCRNLFLRDKKKKMFLVSAANETVADLKYMPSVLDCGRLSFGSAGRLWENLGVRPGSVCPFAIINDTDYNVQMVLDADMMESETVCFHPMENHMTIGLSPDNLVRFIRDTGHEPLICRLSAGA